MRLFVVCVLATSVVGCSFFTVERSTVPRRDGTLGCTTSHASLIGDAAMVAAGTLLMAAARDCDGGYDCIDKGIDYGIPGAFIALAGFYSAMGGMQSIGACERAVVAQQVARDQRANEDAALQHRVAVREQAWKLTVDAEAAARAGDCARVAELEPQIATIDIEMHDVVFARDVAVARCRSGAVIR